jgi:hypothetical protein
LAREFLHQDDFLAPIHTGNSEQMEAIMKGEPVPNKQLSEVVMGPGAFGSPDPATLAHTLLTAGDEPVVAETAPEVEVAEDSSNSGELSADSTAKEFKEAVDNAQSVGELDAIAAIHDSRDEPFATVDSALERRHAQLSDESSNT